jgi:hypothetical protein
MMGELASVLSRKCSSTLVIFLTTEGKNRKYGGVKKEFSP